MRYLLPILQTRRILIVAPLLAILVALPTLNAGYYLDDYKQRIVLIDDPAANPFEFHRFGSPQTQAQMERGLLPWWQHPKSKLAFYRPVAHWLMRLDYRFWPDSPVLMHAHSIVWYVLTCLVMVLVYRRFMSWSLATGLAAVLFVIDGPHGFALAWLANRNVFVAMVAAFLALLCFQRERWRWQIPGCLCFAAAMASGEAALAITGYLFAHEVFLSRRSWLHRIGRLLPYALVAIGWLVYWRVHGFGTAGPGFYTDPGSDPVAFLHNLVYRAPAYLFGQMTSVPVEIFLFLEHSVWRTVTMFAVIACCVLLAVLLWPLLKRSPQARFFALGMCIAALPITGGELVSRSLCFVGFGAIGLLALLFESFFSDSATVTLPKTWSASIFVVVMLALHFVLSPVVYFGGIKAMESLDAKMDTRKLGIPDGQGHDRHVLVLSAMFWYTNLSFPLFKDEALSLGAEPSRPPPAISRLRLLTSGYCAFQLKRVDRDTLLIDCDKGFGDMRQGKWGFDPGDRAQLDDMTATVCKVNANRAPVEIEYRFKPGVLDHYEVYAWDKNHFAPATLPPVGEKRIYRNLPAHPVKGFRNNAL